LCPSLTCPTSRFFSIKWWSVYSFTFRAKSSAASNSPTKWQFCSTNNAKRIVSPVRSYVLNESMLVRDRAIKPFSRGRYVGQLTDWLTHTLSTRSDGMIDSFFLWLIDHGKLKCLPQSATDWLTDWLCQNSIVLDWRNDLRKPTVAYSKLLPPAGWRFNAMAAGDSREYAQVLQQCVRVMLAIQAKGECFCERDLGPQ
jgi:hypothetical protein